MFFLAGARVPESVVDFIEGRVSESIEANHYLTLVRQSSKFYPRYIEWAERLKTTSARALEDYY